MDGWDAHEGVRMLLNEWTHGWNDFDCQPPQHATGQNKEKALSLS